MIELTDPLTWAVLAAGIYMAWNIGSNDLANAQGDVVGSKALTLKQVVVIAGTLNILGAIFLGQKVTHTVGKGIVPIEQIGEGLILGALAILLGAGILITLASWLKLPISTTHSIVGSVLGFGLANVMIGQIDLKVINWPILAKVTISWILSPAAGALMAFIIYRLISKVFIERLDQFGNAERIFRYLVIISSGYQSFSHGSNDVANAIAPLTMIWDFGAGGIPRSLLLLGGLGIALGLATWGYRVVWTVGSRITPLTPSRGFSADIAAATVVLMASNLGLPVSTTHSLVGSIVGIGLARGRRYLEWKTVRNILFSWILTVPAAAILSGGIFLLLVLLIGII